MSCVLRVYTHLIMLDCVGEKKATWIIFFFGSNASECAFGLVRIELCFFFFKLMSGNIVEMNQ